MNKINSDVESLKSPFKESYKAFLIHCKLLGYKIKCFESLRSSARQTELYAYGRTTNIWEKPKTWTMQSMHLWWEAADTVFIDKNWNASWNWPFDEIITIAKMYWMKSLAPAEYCHLEINPFIPIVTVMTAISSLWQKCNSSDRIILHQLNENLRKLK